MRMFCMNMCAHVCMYAAWQRTSVEVHSFVSFRLFFEALFLFFVAQIVFVICVAL